MGYNKYTEYSPKCLSLLNSKIANELAIILFGKGLITKTKYTSSYDKLEVQKINLDGSIVADGAKNNTIFNCYANFSEIFTNLMEGKYSKKMSAFLKLYLIDLYGVAYDYRYNAYYNHETIGYNLSYRFNMNPVSSNNQCDSHIREIIFTVWFYCRSFNKSNKFVKNIILQMFQGDRRLRLFYNQYDKLNDPKSAFTSYGMPHPEENEIFDTYAEKLTKYYFDKTFLENRYIVLTHTEIRLPFSYASIKSKHSFEAEYYNKDKKLIYFTNKNIKNV